MNTMRLFLIVSMMSTPLTHTNPHTPQIPLSDFVVHIDNGELKAELKKYEEMDPHLKMTYIIAGSAVAIAAITGAVILTVHFNQ